MMNISPSEAFLIFGKWRDNASQLQLGIFAKGKPNVGSPAEIIETSEQDESLSIVIVLNGQKKKCRFDFAGAYFEYGEPQDSAVFPEFASRAWASYLHVACSSGNEYLFAERFVSDPADDK